MPECADWGTVGAPAMTAPSESTAAPRRPRSRRRAGVALLTAILAASGALVVAPSSTLAAAVVRNTFTGQASFPEPFGPGEVLSIDAGTTSAPGGSNAPTTLEDLVVLESRPNEIARLADAGGATFNGSTLSVEAPAPFAWVAGSGTVQVKRWDPATSAPSSTDCGSLQASLAVTATTITVTFQRSDAANRCILTVSGIHVIPTAPAPLVTEALLINNGNAPGLPGLVGALALTTSQGVLPAIDLSSDPRAPTWSEPTTLTARFGAVSGERELRLEHRIADVWTSAGVYRTDSRGVALIPIRPDFNRSYRVAFVGGDGLAAGLSNELRIPVRFKSTMSPRHSTATVIKRGTAVTFTATVNPVVSIFPSPRVEFRLYHRVGGTWTVARVTVVRTDATGRATWRPTFASRGEWYVRSRALATSANTVGALTPVARYSVR